MTALATTESRKSTRRGFAYPIVRPLSLATAHPAAECWPPARVTRRAAGVTRRATRGRAEQFETLQTRMATFEAAARGGAERALVVVPSRTSDNPHEPSALAQSFEERLLCSLLELRDPSLRLTYVTSCPIAPQLIDYYLLLLPRRVRRDARSRLTVVALGERSSRPLSEKLLERPRVLERIRCDVARSEHACLVPYTTTRLERELAVSLGVPCYGADPQHAHLGTKSGCRELFARAGVPHPMGREGITSVSAAVEAIVQLRRAKPNLSRAVIKLNDGVAGQGNALVDLERLPEPGSPGEVPGVQRRVELLSPDGCDITPEAFLAKLAQAGGIVEEWLQASELRSPSVQLQVTPFGEVQILSTHDQILGGPTGQRYLGCRFPAAPDYAAQITGLARCVGEQLADIGIIGRFAVDFVVTRDGAGWRPFAIELNLRRGGTTHPYETLALLTGGSYDVDQATFIAPTGRHKHYVATDHMEAPELRALGRDGVLALARHGLFSFDRMRRTGVVFHMLSSLDELGRTGLTAIGDSLKEADDLYESVQANLLRAAARAQDHANVASSTRSALMVA